MKVVILAAGKGVRMGELTKTLPKPLLKVNGKSLLEHKLDLLPKTIEEVIIIIKYLGHLIKEHLGDSYNGIPLRYVEADTRGTAYALAAAKPYLTGKFIVMAGDDLYHQKDIEEMLEEDWALQVARVNRKVSGGAIHFNNGVLEAIMEGEHQGDVHIATSFYTLDSGIFNYKMVPISNDEFGLPQTIVTAKNDYKIKVPIARAWIQVGRPEDLKNAEDLLNQNPRLLID